MAADRRLLRAALVALAVLVLLPAAALSHGGPRVLTSTEGRYHVAADERLIGLDGGTAVLDATVSLEDAETGRPVTGARVHVTVDTPAGRIGPRLAHPRGGTYETLVRLTEPDDWRDVRFHVTVDGPLGSARFAYQAPGLGVWPWQQPLVLAGSLLALVLYLRGWRRLRRRRPDLADAGRLAAFGAGIAVLLLAVISPVDPIGERYLLSAHMLQHVALGDLAPALLLLGLRGPLALFVPPPALLRRLAHAPVLPGVARWLFRPSVALRLGPGVRRLARARPVRRGDPASRAARRRARHVPARRTPGLEPDRRPAPVPPARAQPPDPRRPRPVRAGDGPERRPHLQLPPALRGLREPAGPPARHPAMTDQRLAGLVMLLEQALTVGAALAVFLWQPRLRRSQPGDEALRPA